MDTSALIKQSPLLGGLPAAAIKQLAKGAQTVSLRGGETLFERDTASEALYMVTLGRVRIRFSEGRPVDIGADEIIGEIGALTGEPRMAEAVALRDTLLLKIDADVFRRVMAANDGAARDVLRLIVARLRADTRPRRSARTRSVSVLPLTEDVDAADLARRLAQALGRLMDGHVPMLDRAAVDRDLGTGAAQTHFDAGEANTKLVRWLNDVEADARHIVYHADGIPDPWTLRATRQADRLLLVAGDGKRNTDTLQALETAASSAPRELVRCGGKGRAAELAAQAEADFIHYCPDDDADALNRLARQVAGRATGLVLGGGGARGFAHIGLLRALQEAALPIDLIGGTSMGAFIAAMFAQGASTKDMRDACHATFVAKNHLNDWVIPRVSLIRGSKFLRQLKAVLGDGRVEDLPLPYYCVSTNLTQGQPQVHRTGELAVWVATSMAVPGIAPPIVFNGDLLADGSVVNSVPVDTMHALDRGPIIACDVGAPGELAMPGVKGPSPDAVRKARGKNRPQLSDILMRLTSMTSDLRLVENQRLADLFLRMPVSDVGMFEWDKLDDTIDTGYRHACEVLADAAEDWPGDEEAPDFHVPESWRDAAD